MSADPHEAAPSTAARSRREQIAAATIAVIDAEGYRAATYSRIAAHAGLSSTRLISYHFAGKDELVATVVATVGARIDAAITTALDGIDDPAARLAAYIRAVTGLHVSQRSGMRALAAIVLDHRGDDGASRRSYDHEADRAALGRVEEILRDGQDRGRFRDFDTLVVASAVQRSLDGLVFLLETVPELDLARYAEELVTLFDLGTRRTDGGRGPATVQR